MAANAETIATWQPQVLSSLAVFLRTLSRLVGSCRLDAEQVFSLLSEESFAGTARRQAEEVTRREAERLGRASNGLERLADACDRAARQLNEEVASVRRAVRAQQDDFGFGDQSLREAIAAEVAAQQALATDSAYAQVIADILPEDGAADGGGALPFGASRRGFAGLEDIDSNSFTHPEILRDAHVLDLGTNHSTIAFGDVENAATVITFVPGTGSSAADIRGQLSRIDALVSATGRPPEEVAVVLHSYAAPSGLREAAQGDSHEKAIHRLQTTQAAVVAQSAPGSEHIVAGYSYGATVAAQATGGSGLNADRVLLIASPGAGPDIPSAQDMRLLKRDGQPRPSSENRARVAVATSPYDVIRAAADSGIHGADPNRRKFGATVLDLNRPWYEDVEFVLRVTDRWDRNTNAFSAHTDHYFDDEIFQRKTQEWLEKPVLGDS